MVSKISNDVKVKNSTQNCPEPEKINWNNRHIDLKPTFFQKELIANIAGGILLGLGAVFLAASLTCGLALVAVPSVIITLTTLSAIMSVASIALGITFLSVPNWNDPAFRIRKGQEAVDEIKQNGLSYPQIRARFGSEIDKYTILTNNDLNILLRNEAKSLNYESFVNKHSYASFFILDNINKQYLKKSFIQYLSKWKNLEINQIKSTFQTTCTGLGVEDQDLLPLVLPTLHNDIKEGKFDYEQFRKKNGTACLAVLSMELKLELQTHLLALLKQQQLGLFEAQEKFGEDCKNLKISQEQLAHSLLPQEIEKVKKGEFGYAEFCKRNGKKSLDYIEPNSFQEGVLKEAFLAMPYLEMISQDNDQDRLRFGIGLKTIHDAVQKHALLCTTFSDFYKTHGNAPLKEGILEETQCFVLKTKCLQEMVSEGYKKVSACQGMIEFLNIPLEEIEKFLQFDFNTMNYPDFINKHGLVIFKNHLISSSNTQKMKDKFLSYLKQLPPKSFLNYVADVETFEMITDVQKLLQQQLQSMHTLEELHDKYPLDFFKHKWLKKEDPKIKELVVGYLKKNILAVCQGQDGIVETHVDLLLTKETNTIITNSKINLNQAAAHKQILLAQIEASYTQKIVHADAKRQSQKSSQKASIDHQNGLIQQSKNNLAQIVGSIKECQSKMIQLQQKVKSMGSKKDLANQIIEIKQKIQALEKEKQQSKSNSEKITLEQEIQTLLIQSTALSSTQVKGFHNAVAALQEKAKIDAKIEELKSKLKELTAAPLNLEAKIQQAHQQLQQLQNSLNHFDDIMKDCHQQIAVLESKKSHLSGWPLSNANNVVESYKQQLIWMMKEFDKAIKEIDDEYHTLVYQAELQKQTNKGEVESTFQASLKSITSNCIQMLDKG